MHETAQQYIQRITAHVKGTQPLVVQAATAKKLERLINGVPTSTLRKRPAADKWSASEIVAHLGDAEIVTGFRMRLILGAPGAAIAAYDQDSWATSGHYEKRDPRKSVKQFSVAREANLALLKSLTPEQWKQYEMHSERGRETIEQIVRMAIRRADRLLGCGGPCGAGADNIAPIRRDPRRCRCLDVFTGCVFAHGRALRCHPRSDVRTSTRTGREPYSAATTSRGLARPGTGFRSDALNEGR